MTKKTPETIGRIQETRYYIKDPSLRKLGANVSPFVGPYTTLYGVARALYGPRFPRWGGITVERWSRRAWMPTLVEVVADSPSTIAAKIDDWLLEPRSLRALKERDAHQG